MSATPVEYVLDRLRDALDLLAEGDCAVSPATCRTAVYFGGEVPWDECGTGCAGGKNGMLWAKLVSITPRGSNRGGKCAEYAWTAEFGIVRCVAGMGKDGSPPKPAAVEADAYQQARDADAIFNGLVCCPSPDSPLRDVSLTSWSPLGPNGNCAGGAWLAEGALSVCCG